MILCGGGPGRHTTELEPKGEFRKVRTKNDHCAAKRISFTVRTAPDFLEENRAMA